MILFFDTETTGKADFKSPPDRDWQPRLVQLGAIMTDDDGKELSSINLIVKPNGFVIPEEASSIHGFTTKMAIECGIPLEEVLPVFGSLACNCNTFVAHNIDFDEFVMTGEFIRAGFESHPFETDATFLCTMKGMTDICKLPGPYGFKWPKLQEAYLHAFGKEFDGAHDAMADVRACLALHVWLTKQPVDDVPM